MADLPDVSTGKIPGYDYFQEAQRKGGNPIGAALIDFLTSEGDLPSTLANLIPGPHVPSGMMAPAVAGGLFRSNVANAIIKALKDKPGFYAPEVNKKYIRTLIQQMKALPDKVFENVEDLRFAERPSFVHEGELYEPGGFFAAPGIKLPYTEVKGAPELKKAQIEVQAPHEMRQAPSISKDVIHEFGHSLLDRIASMFGSGKYSKALQRGVGPQTHGVEEPFASMLPEMSGGEITKLLKDLGVEKMDLKKTPPGLTEAARNRAAVKLSQKTGKLVAPENIWHLERTGKRSIKETPQTPEEIAALFHSGGD